MKDYFTTETQREQSKHRDFKTLMNDTDINKITESIIGAAIEVHRHLGPGLLETAYEECLCRELSLRAIPFKRQYQLPVIYKGISVDCSYRLDLLVDQRVVVEIKAVDLLIPIHDAQLLTYLRLGGWKIGLLINFNVPLLKDGIHRLAFGLDENTLVKQTKPPISNLLNKTQR